MNGSRRRSVVHAGVLVMLAAACAQAQWEESVKVTATDGSAGDRYGWSVSVSGDTALVGAYHDDVGGSDSGSAYVLGDVGGEWQEVAKLTASDGAAGDEFGWSVSLDGNTGVVGAYEDDDAGEDSGSAYIFREVGGVWEEIAKLTADDGEEGDEFGWGVSICGDTVVVGSPEHHIDGVKIGSAYVFREIGGKWRQIARLVPEDRPVSSYFGVTVSIQGDTVLVGADVDSSVKLASGSAYVFREVGGKWRQIAKLVPDDARVIGRFGFSVSLCGDTALIGALSGSAYVFREEGGVWEQVTKLLPDGNSGFGSFGFSVSILDGIAVIGDPFDDDGGDENGATYVFREMGGVWRRVAKLIASDGSPGASFGWSVTNGGDTVIIGAQGDDIIAENMGSVYVFTNACLADLDGDGSVTMDDYLVYLDLFASGDDAADLDGDGDADSDDFFVYLDWFLAGC